MVLDRIMTFTLRTRDLDSNVDQLKYTIHLWICLPKYYHHLKYCLLEPIMLGLFTQWKSYHWSIKQFQVFKMLSCVSTSSLSFPAREDMLIVVTRIFGVAVMITFLARKIRKSLFSLELSKGRLDHRSRKFRLVLKWYECGDSHNLAAISVGMHAQKEVSSEQGSVEMKSP